jgi:hypothetical protein
VFPVKYELGFYIPEDDILHSRHLENLKSFRVEANVNEENEGEREESFDIFKCPLFIRKYHEKYPLFPVGNENLQVQWRTLFPRIERTQTETETQNELPRSVGSAVENGPLPPLK